MKTSLKDPLANAITNIDLINKFVAASKNDQIIRATDKTLGKSPVRDIQFYCRNGKFEQLWQKLTDWTVGAKNKQTIAKNAIINNLNIIKNNPEFLEKLSDQNQRKIINSIHKIIMTVKSAEKDITSSMIQRDLQDLNDYLKTSAGHQKKSELSNTLAGSSVGDVANSEAESDLNAAKVNNTGSYITELVGIDIDEGVTVVMHPSEIDNFENNIKANISKNMSSYISKLANVTSIDLAEVVFKSEDPENAGRPYKEPDSKLAESAPTINTTPAPIGKAIEQSTDAVEAGTEITPSPAPSAPSLKAETKSTANTNPYLASLKSVWNPSSSGRHEITTLFSISGDVNPSNIIAQAYIHPSGKKLNFSGDAKKSVGTASSYITVEAEVPKSKFFIGTGPITNTRTENRLVQFRDALFNTYIESFNKIDAEYKESNPGKELETLVIVPISSTDGTLSDSHVTALVSAVQSIQHENENLKIAISAEKDAHAARIRVAYEENMQ